MLGVVTGDVHILGNGQHHIVVGVHNAVVAALVKNFVYLAAKTDLFGLIFLGDQPGIAHIQPLVGQFHLLAVDDLLLEDAQLVADGVAGGGNVQSGHGIQIAGCQTAQTAIAQTGIGLQLEQVRSREAQRFNGLLQGLQNAQVVGILHQGATHQKFEGQVVDLTGMGVDGLVLGNHPAGRHDVAQNHGAGFENVLCGCFIHVAAEVAAQLCDNQFGQFLLGVRVH